jgi:hypothetical protein
VAVVVVNIGAVCRCDHCDDFDDDHDDNEDDDGVVVVFVDVDDP